MIIHLQMDDRTGSEVSPSDALTLSHLTDLWRREKFCPSSERRRSGGEREPFASGVSSCALGCSWELAPPHGDGSGSLVGLALRPVGVEEICSAPFSPSSRHRKSLIPESGHARLVSRLLWHLQVADEQLISAASSRLEEGGRRGAEGGILEHQCLFISVLVQFPAESRRHSNGRWQTTDLCLHHLVSLRTAAWLGCGGCSEPLPISSRRHLDGRPEPDDSSYNSPPPNRAPAHSTAHQKPAVNSEGSLSFPPKPRSSACLSPFRQQLWHGDDSAVTPSSCAGLRSLESSCFGF